MSEYFENMTNITPAKLVQAVHNAELSFRIKVVFLAFSSL